MTTSETTDRTARVSGLAQLVTYVPHQLGFHPRRSVVVMALEDGHLLATARVDAPGDPDQVDEIAISVTGPLARAGADAAVVLLYDPDPLGLDLADAVQEELELYLGADTVHLLLVRVGLDGRTELQVDHCPFDCCGRLGVWQAAPPSEAVDAVASHVLREDGVLADRESLEATLRASHPEVLEAVTAVLVADPQTVPDDTTTARAWAQLMDHRDGAVPVLDLPAEVLATALGALADIPLRDRLYSALVPDLRLSIDAGALTGALAEWLEAPPPQRIDDPVLRDRAVNRVRHRLRELCTVAPEGWITEALCLLGYWCWAHGGGAMTGIALEAALTHDPGHGMARLLLQAQTHGMRPRDLGPTQREGRV